MAVATTSDLSLQIMCRGKRTFQQQHLQKECNTSTKLNVNLVNYEHFGEIKQNEIGKPWIQQNNHLNILMINKNKMLCSKNVIKSKSNDKTMHRKQKKIKKTRNWNTDIYCDLLELHHYYIRCCM